MRKSSQPSSVYDRLSKPKNVTEKRRTSVSSSTSSYGNIADFFDEATTSSAAPAAAQPSHNMTSTTTSRHHPVSHDETSVKDLAKIVSELRRESLRHLDLETETQTEFEYVSSQMKSTRGAVGKLADIMLEDLETLRADFKSQLQEYQISSNQRLADMQNAIERLEFRFAHHLRDCQVMADQVDRTADGVSAVKNQTYAFQIAAEKSNDALVAELKEVRAASKAAEERAAVAIHQCSNRTESFQERLVTFAKDVDGQLRTAINSTEAKLQEVDAKAKRHSTALHHVRFKVVMCLI